VGLNYRGNLSVFQGNGDAERLSVGEDIEDWQITPLVSLPPGPGFDVCGAWLMRAFTDTDRVRTFYHAERACNYNANGQTRKSAGYAESFDGGLTFSKPNYPNNKIVDTSTAELPGEPSGEGDYGVVRKDGYYYMYFSDVENGSLGVARATVASGGTPGSWFKYYNGTWNQSGLGGLSAPMRQLTGTQAYLHTPSDSILSVGNRDAYYQTGTALSSSIDGVNWNFVADPLIAGDFAINTDTILYQSLLGKTGGYDVGSQFDLFYMWIPPGATWNTRYQIRRSVTMKYIGNTNSSTPSTSLALTSYVNRVTGERMESIELALYPYMPKNIIGYVMTRPYPNTFPAYECYRYATLDHFIGTADECISANVEAFRVAGHMWSTRVARSVAVYRCSTSADTFLSLAADCEGLATAQTAPFGYVMQGPDISPSVMARDILIPQGQTWSYVSGAMPASQNGVAWTALAFDDSRWTVASAPFGTGYGSDIIATPFGPSDYYFRREFTVPVGKTLTRVVASVASDDYSYVYVNGVLIDSDQVVHHEAAYWNRQIFVPLSLINLKGSTNVIAVLTKNSDQWAFFDFELTVRYTETPVPVTLVSMTCGTDCGVKGQCVNGACVCDKGWSGPACATSLCSYSGSSTTTSIPAGSAWRHSQWSYVPSTPANWFAPTFADYWLQQDTAPFGTSDYTYTTYAPAVRHLFRKTVVVSVPYNQVIASGVVSIASAANHRVWLNGVFLGAPSYPADYHSATHWNGVFNVDGSLFTTSSNTIAVEINPSNSLYFDLQLQLTFATKTCTNATATTTLSVSATTTAAAAAATTAAAAAATSATVAATSTGAASSSGKAATTNVGATTGQPVRTTTGQPINATSTGQPTNATTTGKPANGTTTGNTTAQGTNATTTGHPSTTASSTPTPIPTEAPGGDAIHDSGAGRHAACTLVIFTCMLSVLVF